MTCSDKRKDCAARTQYGGCNALRDTNFGGRPCPFYQSKRENERVQREIDARNGIKRTKGKA